VKNAWTLSPIPLFAFMVWWVRTVATVS
jgi:hypothetical protein